MSLSIGGLVDPGFQRWVEQSVTSLATMFATEDVERLLRTSAYWHTIDMPPSYPQVQTIVGHEIDAIGLRLTSLAGDLRQFHGRWGVPSHIVVPDTNIFIEHHERFDRIDWSAVANLRPDRPLRLVVPLMVLDELDGLKVTLARSKENEDTATKGWRVRHALRRMEGLFQFGRGELPDCGAAPSLLVTIEALPDPLLHQRLNINDAEIVSRCVALQRLVGSEVSLVSNDTNMLIRARQAGLRPVRLTPLAIESPSAPKDS